MTEMLAMLHSFAPPSVLPDISPARGEIGRPLSYSPITNVGEEAQAKRKADLPPCGGDVRQDRGGRHRTPSVPVQGPVP
jgi:hypothetical protein